MLATSIDILEGLLMKQSAQTVLLHHFLKDFHRDHVLIDSSSRIVADRAYLKLIECNFIVLCFERDSYFMQLFLNLKQSYSHSLWKLAVVMLTQLLISWGNVSGDRPPKETQILPAFETGLLDREELLLETQKNHS